MAVPPPPHPSGDRAALRRALRRRRAAFRDAMTADGHLASLAALAARLAPLLGREGPIAGYVPHRREADVMPFLLSAHHAGHAVALPHVPEGEAAGTMRFLRWLPEAKLTSGLAGIPQPAGGDILLPAIVLAPLLGFDRRGGRIGQGGGFYDRWFAAHPQALRVGIAWSVQEVAAIPLEPWDMPLHAIATEQEWIVP